MSMAQKYYAVRQGKVPGIYLSWDACRAQVYGYSQAVYKSFPTREEAEKFMQNDTAPMNDTLTEDADGTEPGLLKAYVDGSYIPTKADSFAYGVVFLDENGIQTASGVSTDPDLATMRNVAGEIHGAAYAMQYALEKGYKKLCIYHDYEGIARWCLGDWKTNREGTRAYKAYYDSIKDRLEIHFVKVKGHSGDTYNEMADQLAKKALGL